MSKDNSGTWNIWTGLSGGEGGNVWIKAIKDNHQRQTKGFGEFVRETMEKQSSYDPYRDSANHITGYTAKQSDPFSAGIAAVSDIHGTPLGSSDGIASAVSHHVHVDNETGVTTLSEDLYGKVDYGADGRNFLQIGADLAGSVMDQFQSLSDANSYNPSIYSAAGMGTQGLFAGFGGNSGDRRDHFGRVIQTEGLQDYVEEGGRRWNIDMAGNQTEVNALTGQPFETAGGLDSFYSSTGWDANQGGWSNTGVGSFYGTANGNDAGIWGTSSTGGSANIWGTSDPAQSIYGYTDPNASSGNDFWGAANTQSTGWGTGANESQNHAAANNSAWGIYGSSGHGSGSDRREESQSNWFFNGNTTA